MTPRDKRIRKTWHRLQNADKEHRHALQEQFFYLAGAPQARGTWALGYPEYQQPWEIAGWEMGRGSYRSQRPIGIEE